ncbi:MAG TPA: alpha/beta hydrolase [Sphingomicrobium sp.]|nr:alpha/beta hydrolase [Sphingomicrobium sp.]
MSALRKLAAVLSTAATGVGIAAYSRYRSEMREIRRGVEKGGTLVQTSVGPVEYAEQGKGEPMLTIHGAGGGYDQGLFIARDFASGHRLIAPSRFGYLKTPVPEDHSPAAQADAHAALLDHLGVEKSIVVGTSAGAPSAIELTLRHPERVSALVLLVPRTYHPTQAIGADESVPSQAVLRLIEASADFLFWLVMRVSRASVVRFLGVPPEVEARASDEERARVTEVMNSILPLSARVRGIEVDGLTEMSPWPLEKIAVPTLIISAEDDLYKTLPGARFTAERIRGAELKVLESGGHLMIGQSERVREWVTDFLRGHRKTARRIDRTVSKVLEPVV